MPGLEVNEELWDFYDNDSLSGSAGGALNTYGVYAGPNGGLKETPVDTIERNVDESTYDEYGDAAIVLISRMGNEAGDLPRA